jgi:O-glycosyl hydrolase
MLAFAGMTLSATGATTLTVNGAKTYQAIEGFGVNANYYGWNSTDLEPALDALIDGAGMTLFRIVFNNGWETNNDNADANAMNWSYYNSVYGSANAQKLWGLMGYLNQKGITNGITLNFQGAGPDWMMNGSRLATGYESEWAEMIESLLLYARYTNHLQFNLVAPNNEPDITGEGINIPTVSQYLATLHNLAQRLDTNGLTDMKMVAPDRSTANTNWLPEMMTDPLIMSKLAHFGLHSYSSGGTGSQGVSNLLAHSSYPDRTFWMTEFNVWCDVCEYGASGTNDWLYSLGTADFLLGHLANGASAGMVWEGYDSYYPHHGRWSYWGLLAVVNTNATPKTYTPRKGFYTLAQIAKFVRPGAVRVDGAGSIAPLYALAFYHTNDGQLTIVGDNSGGATVLNGRLTNLPPINALELYYTDANTNLYHSASVPVSNNTFSITVPASCVFTLAGLDASHSSVSVSLANPADGQRYAAPGDIVLQANATTTTGAVNQVAFYSNGVKIGADATAPYGLTWSNVPAGAYQLSASATNSLGDAGSSPTIQVLVVGPAAQITVSPASATVLPFTSQPFVATVKDAAGTALQPQPAVTWSVNSGGVVDAAGLFTAAAVAGGPFTVTAQAGSITGSASVYVTTNVNIAGSGTGYIWYSLTSSNSISPTAGDARINDGDLAADVILGPGGAEDISNAWEAAGVIWSAPQSINRVVYVNGSHDADHDGVFAADFGLQLSTNGTSWTPAGAAWVQSPAYPYDSAAAAHGQFSFNGPGTAVRGVRAIGRVHTSSVSSNSWVAYATEVQAFATSGTAPAPILSGSLATNGFAVSWPALLSNYALESATNALVDPAWLPVTNVPVLVGTQACVWVPTIPDARFFRLRKQ